MKLDSPGKHVLFLHLAFLAIGALAGAAIGWPQHVVLGTSLGSLLGTIIPGLLAEFAVKRDKSASQFRHLCAAVYNNRWVTSEEMRDIVQEIRGQVYGPWMGLVIGALLGCYLLQLPAAGCFAVAVGLGAAAWVLGRLFD